MDKKGIIDAKTANIENSTGQVNGNKVDTKYGQIDLVKHQILLSDPKGKTESKDFKIDPISGQILISGKHVINPKTGKPDKDFAQILSLKIVNRRLDPSTGQVVSSAEGKDVVVDPKTNKIWVSSDPNEASYTSSQIDPKTGQITLVYGWLNPKTNEVEKQNKINPSIVITSADGVVYTATGEIDEATNQPIFATSIIEPETKNVITKVNKVNPKTGEIILIRLDYPKTQGLPQSLQLQQQQPQSTVITEQITVATTTPTKPPSQAKQVTPPKVPVVGKTTTTKTAITSPTSPPPPKPIEQRSSVSPSKEPARTSPIKSILSPTITATQKTVPTAAAAGLDTVSIVPQKNAVIEIVAIVGKVDKAGKVDLSNANLERTLGILNVQDGTIDTKYGQVNPSQKTVKVITDPKSGKAVSRDIVVEPATGKILITGVIDAKGKVDNSQGQIISLGSEIENPVVEVTAISGKYDSKKNIIDPKTAVVDVTEGKFDANTNRISTSYGELDIPTQTITFKHPKTGKQEKKDVKFDSIGQALLKNELNPKSGKLEKDYARILNLRIVHRKIDPITGKVSASSITGKDIIVDPQTNQIWVPTSKDPITSETIYTSAQVDPKTGYIITLYGYLDPKTNKINKHTAIESNITKIDPTSGQLFMATGDVDESGEPLFQTSQVDEESGEVYTKVAKVDPKTGKLILIKIILITKKDERGVPKEVDANTVDIDQTTGAIRNIFNKTVVR